MNWKQLSDFYALSLSPEDRISTIDRGAGLENKFWTGKEREYESIKSNQPK